MSCQLSYIMYSPTSRVPRIRTKRNSDAGGLRRSFWFCPALQTQSYKLKHCAYLDQLMGGSCPHALKAQPVHFTLSCRHLCCSGWTLWCFQIKLFEIKYESCIVVAYLMC